MPTSLVLRELHDGKFLDATAADLMSLVGQARGFLREHNLQKGDRCALLAANSIEWVAIDLAIMAEGLIVVPLYSRQAIPELVAMMKDCSPALLLCGDATLRDAVRAEWPQTPATFTFDEVFAAPAKQTPAPQAAIQDSDPVTIIYTSGTSGAAKGVVLTAGNVAHMLANTSSRLDRLTQWKRDGDRVFHYLPFCFAGSWIMLLTCLLRLNRLTINTDLAQIASDMRLAQADYFLNVPALLERMRKAVDEQLWKTGGLVRAIYTKAKSAWMRKQEGEASATDALWLAIARTAVFPTIRKKMIGGNLRALVCGSAP